MTRYLAFSLASLLVLALTSISATANIIGPYTADSNTLHLWHLDEADPGPAAPAAGVTGSFDLTPDQGATLGAASFAGFGTAGDETAGTAAGFMGSSIAVSDVTGADGAFTFEAMIRTANTTDSQQIVSMENGGGASARPFQFRIDGGNMRFINIAQGVQQILGGIPTSGDDAFVADEWFHVAATYNGIENTPGNLKLYWTRMDDTRTEANEIFTTNMTGDLAGNDSVLGIGNEYRGTPDNNIQGQIDEVRISDIARGPFDFLFGGGVIPNQWNVDGGGSFNTATNWLDNVVPTSTALFGDVLTGPDAPASVTLDSAVSLEEVSFRNGSTYSLDGPSTLTLTGGATVDSSGGMHFINAPIAGSAGLTKTGAGTVVLSNSSNSYTGDTTVSAGTLIVTDLGAINQASGVTNVAAGATLQFDGDGEGNGASGTLTEEITGGGNIRLTTGLTTEVITADAANSSLAGSVSIGGGTLVAANSAALGTADGTAATGTALGGFFEEGTLELSGVTVADERLQIGGRQPGITAPHLSSTGTSTWTGPIVGVTGGNQYNIESQSGTLTLSGDITMPDSSERFINLNGAGDGVITGQIIDRTFAPGDGAENTSISVVKTGAGTWTIATTPPPTARDGYHQRRTVIEQGTLAVQSSGTDAGELFSRTIEVKSGATFDVSSFSNYSLQVLDDPDETPSTGDETGQELSGAGTVNVGGTLSAFDDSSILPGDSVGTLTVNGNFSYSTFAATPAGSWDYELGNSTAAGDSDRLLVNGTATINAGASADRINVNITPTGGTLASGSYTLVQANSLSVAGSASDSTYDEKVFNAQGNEITGDIRQTVAVANSGNNVVLNVTGSSANLNWAGTSGNVWDVRTTNNWTGGDTQFRQLDNVTFGNVANKSVTVDVDVAPGSVTLDGGGGSTYTVTGTGGMTGFGAVSVDSGTVQLKNAGNNYSGTTTVASGARLEMDTATTGDMVVNGTLAVGGNGVALGGAQTFFSDDFSGAGGTPLNGTTPDTSFSGANWVAAATFEDNGDSVAGPSGGSATLAFTPINGSTYTLETTLENITGDNDWFALGFASGQSTANSAAARFITGAPEGLAWALYRGDASSSPNTAFLGDTSVEPNSGLASGSDWLVGVNQSGGNVGIRLTLDTTGGAGNWTVLMEADTGSGFQTIRATEAMLDDAINSVGIANSNTADLTGTINSFSLTGVEPADSRLLGQTVTVDGDLTMGDDATLDFDFALSGQDFLDVTGSASLNGTINVTQLGSFTPDVGTQYTLLSAAGGITDLGVDYNLPTSFSASIVDLTDLVLTFSAALDGDFNNSGLVEQGDLDLVLLNWGEPVPPTPNGWVNQVPDDGSVDQNDLDLVLLNWGSSAAASAAAVPEPGSLILMLSAMLGLVAARRVRS